jgi:CHAT domain-containing protein
MTPPETHAAFPSDETLAAFIDGKLDEATRRRVIEHMATCAECYDVVLGANELRGATNVVPFQRRRYGVISLVAAAAAVVVALFVGPIRERLMPRQKSGLAALAEVAPKERNVEGRLSGFPYRPLKPVKRGVGGGEEGTTANDLKLQSVASQIGEAAEANPTPENLHQYGVALLLLGKPDAISRLEEAVHKETGEAALLDAIHGSKNASLLSDLSAAYVSRGQRTATSQDFLLANEAADRAWKLEPTAEHAWNRAMAIEHLGGGGHAIKAWNDYLQLDPSSTWSAEARKHIRAPKPNTFQRWQGEKDRFVLEARAGNLEAVRQIVRRFPQQSRSCVEDEIVPAWAGAVSANDRSAARELASVVTTAGEALRIEASDAFVADVGESVRDASEAPKLARAITAYHRARRDMAAQHGSHVAETLEKEAAALSDQHCPLWLRAGTYAATAFFYSGKFDKTLHLTGDVLAGVPSSGGKPGYASVLLQAYWARGLAQCSLGRQYECLDSYRSAASWSDRLGETESSGFLRILIAENLQHLNQPSQAWNAAFEGARILRESGSPKRMPLVYSTAARSALDSGFVASASTFNTLAYQVPTQEPTYRITALLVTATAAAMQQNGDEAAVAISAATRLCEAIGDPDVRRRAWADIQIVRAGGEIGDWSRPRTSIRVDRSAELLDEAIRFFQERHDAFRLPALLFARAQARGRRGHVPEALVDYEQAFALLQPFNGANVGTANRRAWESATRRFVDDAIRLAVTHGEMEAAFRWTERVRLARFADSSSTTSTAALRQSLNQGDLLVSFWSEPDVLYVWALSRDASTFSISSEPRADLTARGQRLRASLARASRDQGEAAELTGRIFGPIAKRLQNARRLIVVPDRSMSGIPFAALYDAGRHRYLCQDLAVVVAPSASRVASRRDATEFARKSLLIVADPAFDSDAFPRLARLSGARLEPDAIQGIFGRTLRLTGSTATPANVRRQLSEYTTLHYAGHAISNDQQPDLSALLLAQDNGGGEQLLYASDIRSMKLRNLSLVVLHGCETAAGSGDGGDFSPLASAFLQAGVPVVLGTLWPIDDASANGFVTAFYRELSLGKDPVLALQEVQAREASRGTNIWQAYEILSA